MLNEKQEKILEYIKEHIIEKGFAPSIREICKEFGFSSPRAGQKHLIALSEKGFIARENKPRGIKVFSLQNMATMTLPMLGYIAAGAPIEVVEQSEEIEVPSSLIGRRPCYVLQVKGDSMVEDHILSGDFIVVEKAETADDGEVVVALLNNQSATLKRFFKEKNRIRLQPANSDYKPIYVRDVAIQGKVRGLFRRF